MHTRAHTHIHSLSHTHTHTHIHSLTHTHAHTLSGLLCKGDLAKAIFLTAGGLPALIMVAGAPKKSLRALAPTCTALLNLSSYIPVQVGDRPSIVSPSSSHPLDSLL